jgi:hypothetical protein
MWTRPIIVFFNFLATSIIAGGLGFFCMALWLGTQDQRQELINGLPTTFFSRFGFFWTVGLVVITMLTSLNYILNKNLFKDNPIKLKKLFFGGLLFLTMTCTIGCLYFFYR